jgi:hypothetical protein
MYRSIYSWPRHYLEVSGQLHAPATLPPGKGTQYALDRRLGGPPGLELWSLSRPGRSQSLYRQRYTEDDES